MWAIIVRSKSVSGIFSLFTTGVSNDINLPKRKFIFEKYGYNEGNDTHVFHKDDIKINLKWYSNTIDMSALSLRSKLDEIIDFKNKVKELDSLLFYELEKINYDLINQ